MTDWQRLEQVIKWAEKNTNSFAKALGLNRTENLYQIKKGNNRISRSLATKIVTVFPSINKTWLIFGDGDMLLDENSTEDSIKEVKAVPFYEGDTYSILKSSNNDLFEPIYNISIPSVGDCDFAIRVNSNALEPKILLGSILLLKEISVSDIMYGYKYLLTINGECTLRIVKRDKEFPDDLVILKSLNPDFESTIKKSDIETIHLVKGSISLF